MSKAPEKKAEAKETPPATKDAPASADPKAAPAAGAATGTATAAPAHGEAAPPAEKPPSAISKLMAKVLPPVKAAVAKIAAKLKPPKVDKQALIQGFKTFGQTLLGLPMLLIRGDGVDRFAVVGFVASAALVTLAVPRLAHMRILPKEAEVPSGTSAGLGASKEGVAGLVQQQHPEVLPPPDGEEPAPEPLSLPKEQLKHVVSVGTVPALGGYFEVFVRALTSQTLATIQSNTGLIKSAVAPLLINLEVAPLFQNEKATSEESARVTQEFLASPQGHLGVAAVILVPVAQVHTKGPQKQDKLAKDKPSEHSSTHEHKTPAH